MHFMPQLNKFTFLKRAILVVAPFILISACEKPTDDLGFNQVIGSTINADTLHLPLISYTTEIDSILVAAAYSFQTGALNGYSPTRLMGINNSTYFGQSKAIMLAEVLPLQVNPDFGESPVIDSVSLYLRITGAYGDTTQAMNIEVHEFAENLSKDSLFFSNFKATLGDKIGELNNFYPKPKTVSQFEGQAAVPLVRIPLNTDYFQTRFADVGDGSFDGFSSFSKFLDYFKGLQVSATNGAAILTFNLESNFSALRIHYHNTEDTTAIELDFDPDRGLVPITFSVFEHDYAMGLIDFNSTDTVNGDDQTYIQAMGGVATALKFNRTKLDSLSQQGFVINRALLEVSTAIGTGESVAPSSRLEIRELVGKGLGARSIDFQDDRGGGQLRLGVFRDNRYTFDLTQEIFDILNTGQFRTLALVPSSRTTSANRTILQGGSSPLERAKLIVYYTQP